MNFNKLHELQAVQGHDLTGSDGFSDGLWALPRYIAFQTRRNPSSDYLATLRVGNAERSTTRHVISEFSQYAGEDDSFE